MKTRAPRTGGRSVGLLVLAVIVAGIIGSVVSFFVAGAFPAGPVRDFFFLSRDIGIPTFTVNLGFVVFTLGLTFSVAAFTVIFITLAVYLWYKL